MLQGNAYILGLHYTWVYMGYHYLDFCLCAFGGALQVDQASGFMAQFFRILGVWSLITWRARGLSKSFISGVIIGVTPFRVLIALPITYLLSPLPLQVRYNSSEF